MFMPSVCFWAMLTCLLVLLLLLCSHVVGLRAVCSSDGMTADWYPFTPEFLRTVSARICNQVSLGPVGWADSTHKDVCLSVTYSSVGSVGGCDLHVGIVATTRVAQPTVNATLPCCGPVTCC
jgi:hypothetical protein